MLASLLPCFGRRNGPCVLALASALAAGSVSAAAPSGPDAPGPAPKATAHPTPSAPAPGCAPTAPRAAYVTLKAPTEAALAQQLHQCEAWGYRALSGVAHAVVMNPGAPAADEYSQVVIIPPGAPTPASAPASAPTPASARP